MVSHHDRAANISDSAQAGGYLGIQVCLQETAQKICDDSGYRATLRPHRGAGRASGAQVIEQSYGRSSAVGHSSARPWHTKLIVYRFEGLQRFEILGTIPESAELKFTSQARDTLYGCHQLRRLAQKSRPRTAIGG